MTWPTVIFLNIRNKKIFIFIKSPVDLIRSTPYGDAWENNSAVTFL